MKTIRLLLCLLPIYFTAMTVNAQSAVSNVISFSLSDFKLDTLKQNDNRPLSKPQPKTSGNGMFMPPDLFVDIDFIDANNNKILEALENGSILITLHNHGGKAEGVSVDLTPVKKLPGLLFDATSKKVDIPSGGEIVTVFPLSAGIDIPTDSLQFDIRCLRM